MPKLTSQFGEDMYVYNNFINVPSTDGTFVELGAMDGEEYSNTYFFETSLLFNGVLIEPSHQFQQLLINRPNAKCYNYAINYDSSYSIFIGDGPCGGIEDEMAESYINKHIGDNPKRYLVKCSPIKDIIQHSGLTYIDLLSIDVEGGELAVLETLNFNIPMYVIIIELDGHNVKKDQKCRDILIKNGFTFNIRVNINEFWINENYFRRDKLYNKSVEKINFSNMRNFGSIPCLDMNHSNIHELRDSLLLSNK